MSGRTTWWSKDAAWHRRGRVVKLGRKFGPAGPMVLDWLTCEAKSQGPARGHDGTVKTDYDAIAHGCWVDPEQAEEIVAVAVEIGALDDFDDLGNGLFVGRISGWDEDIERPLAATRKAVQRASDKVGQTGTTGDMSPNVPECPPTEQGHNKDKSSLRSDTARKRAAKPVTVDPDSLPENLPERLVPVADVVYVRLARLAERKAAKPVTRHRVGDLIADYPDHDHQRIAGEFEDYWTHGGGAGASMRDVPLTYRNRLSKLPATPAAALGSSAAHLAVVPSATDQAYAAWNRGNKAPNGGAA